MPGLKRTMSPPPRRRRSAGKRGNDGPGRIVGLQRDAAVAFLEADVDGDQQVRAPSHG